MLRIAEMGLLTKLNITNLMKRRTKIECTAEVRELNEAIETADLLTSYQWDQFTGEQVACALENSGCPYHAADLRNKMAAVESLEVAP